MENYEQKYKEAISKARECMKDGGISQNTIDYLCNIFPELTESNDERIRKALIAYFQRFPYGGIENAGTNPKEAIAWLEKQVEQKLDDEEKVKAFLISKDYPISANGDIPTYKELFEIIKDGIEYQQKQGEKPQGKTALEAANEEKVDNANKIEPNLHVGDNKDNERLIKAAIAFLKLFADEGYENAVECIDWLEKQGEKEIEPKSDVWTKKDKIILEGIIDEIEADKNEAPSYDLPIYDKYLNWLKSLKKKIINE